MKSVRLQGIFVGSRQMFEDMNRAIVLNGLKPVIGQTFPLGKSAGSVGVHGERLALWEDR